MNADCTTGEADLDGDVDGDDFLIWQRGLGLTMQVTNANGDANGDGVVNADDLSEWRSQFGAPQSAAAGAPVPEPTAAMIALGRPGRFCGCLEEFAGLAPVWRLRVTESSSW